MDFILRKLDRRIQYCEASGDLELPTLYRAKIEYCLIFWLAYLWNKNIEYLDSDAKAFLLTKVQRPSIGTIAELGRRLDLQKELSRDKDISSLFGEWPGLRNEMLGHGYVFGDEVASLTATLRRLSLKVSLPLIDGASEIDLITIRSQLGDVLSGTLFTNSGDYHPWNLSLQALSGRPGETYAHVAPSTYRRLSPFISLKDEDDIYVFRSIREPLTGSFVYNRLLHTGSCIDEWPDFANQDLEIDTARRLTSNKTVINLFEPNYKRYIDVGLKRLVLDFVIKNTSSVCATVWGHGGVGKTAAVQSACDLIPSQVFSATSTSDRYEGSLKFFFPSF